MNYKCIESDQLCENFIKDVNDWMLISAYDNQRQDIKYNGMTASWGGTGVLWHKKIFWCVIRPQRFTLDYCNNAKYISLSFFDPKYRDALTFCGRESGRNHQDKLRESGLTPVIDSEQIIDFEQARLTLVGKKLYIGDINPENFVDKEIIQRHYPEKDFHKVFVCEIVQARVHED